MTASKPRKSKAKNTVASAAVKTASKPRAKRQRLTDDEREDQKIIATLAGSLAASRVLDSPEVLHAVLAMIRAEGARREATKKALTPTQKRRVAKSLEGQSIREIATAEGRASSTIGECLAAPTVRAHIAAKLRIMRAGEESLFDALLERLASIAFNATRPGPGYMVPDHRMRFDAILKLLHYYDPGDGGGGTSERAPGEAINGSEPIAAVTTTIEQSLIATKRLAVTTRTEPGRIRTKDAR